MKVENVVHAIARRVEVFGMWVVVDDADVFIELPYATKGHRVRDLRIIYQPGDVVAVRILRRAPDVSIWIGEVPK